MDKKRDISIDILKCIAAVIITNSHMEQLYGDYAVFATGGAIGDALFFFCSGYTLFLGQDADFFNWYKKRINRIYPTVFTVCLIYSLLNYDHWQMKGIDQVLLYGGGWFVSCIMIYYAILWFVKRYMIHRLWVVFTATICVIGGWYAFFGFGKFNCNNMYGADYFKWSVFFLYMIAGGYMGLVKNKRETYHGLTFIKSMTLFIICVISFYGLYWFKCKIGMVYDILQMLSIIPLMGITFSLYSLCNTSKLLNLYNGMKYVKFMIRFIGGLCLEIYLIQSLLFTDKWNGIFPFNIVLMFILILMAAYVTRCISRIWSQTFKDSNYDWKAIISFV